LMTDHTSTLGTFTTNSYLQVNRPLRDFTRISFLKSSSSFNFIKIEKVGNYCKVVAYLTHLWWLLFCWTSN
jgi:hypothetical protein